MREYLRILVILFFIFWCGNIIVDNYYYRPQERLQDYFLGYLAGTNAQKDSTTGNYSFGQIFNRIEQDKQKFLGETK